MKRMMNRGLLKSGLLASVLLTSALSGCVGYNVYPPETGTAGFTDPSSPPMYQIMTEGLKWAVRKYPPGDQTPPTASDVPIPPSEAEAAAAARGNGEAARVAISLFTIMRPDVYQYAVDQIGQGAVPLTAETQHLPRYMVSRVWVLGDEAKVDIFRPVTRIAVDGSIASTVYQPITVNLRGGMKFWRVTSYRVWSIGTFHPPEPQYLGGVVFDPPPEPAHQPGWGEPSTPSTPGGEPQGETPSGETAPAIEPSSGGGEPAGAPSDPR